MKKRTRHVSPMKTSSVVIKKRKRQGPSHKIVRHINNQAKKLKKNQQK